MEQSLYVEGIYFEGKPYVKNRIIDQKIIKNINDLKENTGKDPVIKISLGAK